MCATCIAYCDRGRSSCAHIFHPLNILVLILAGAACAQETRSMILGRVLDPVSSDFGKVTSTSGSSRWVQVMARLQF